MRKATLLTLALSVSALFASAQSTTEAPSLKTFESGKVYSIKNVQQHKFAAAMPQTGDMACSSTLNLACLFTITPVDGSTGTYTIKPYADDTKVVYSIKVANADNTVGIKAADNDANTKWKIADAPDDNYVTIISSNSTATNGYWNHRGTNADWNLSGIGGYTANNDNPGSFWTIAEVLEADIATAKTEFVNNYSTIISSIPSDQISDKLGYYSQALIDEAKSKITNATDNKTVYNSAISLANLINYPVDGKVYNLYALQSDGTKNYPGGTEGKWVAQKLENNFYNFVNTTADKEGLKNWQGSNPKYSVSINQRKQIGAITLKIDGETNYLCVGSNGVVDRLNAGFNSFGDNKFSTDFIFEEVSSTDAGHAVTFTASTDGKAYATLNLPFTTTIPAGVTAYKKVDGTESSVKLEVYKNEKEVLPANTPVLLQANEAGTKTFVPAAYVAKDNTTGFSGTLAATAVTADNAYILAKDGNTVKFCRLSATNNKVNANKAYLTVPAASATALNFDFGGVATGIENAVADKANNTPIYDLSGRRVMNAVKGGIYIQNGKKFVK